MKNQHRGGGLPKKGGGAWTVSQFKGGTWQERGGGVFEDGLIPQCTLCCLPQLNILSVRFDACCIYWFMILS